MATIKRCDRCGKDHGVNDRHSESTLPVQIPVVDRYARHSSFNEEHDRISKTYDLCQSCMVELNEWLKPLAKAAP